MGNHENKSDKAAGAEKIFDFLGKAEKLKSTLRYNKLPSGRQESSAEHSWRLALMVFVVADELEIHLDISRAVRMAIVHDLAEAICGDIDAVKILEGKYSKEMKKENELNAMNLLKRCLPNTSGDGVFGLWKEYEECSTDVAKFVKAMDKIETLTQLAESGSKYYDKPEFIANYADQAVLDFPVLKGLLKALKNKLKLEFEKGDIEWKIEYDEIMK